MRACFRALRLGSVPANPIRAPPVATRAMLVSKVGGRGRQGLRGCDVVTHALIE